MLIILLEKIKKLGDIGDIAKVKAGYARNYLVSNNKAIPHTKENLEIFKQKKENIVKQNNQKKQQILKQINTIKDRDIILIKQASEDGKLYGSITTTDIYLELKAIGIEAKKENILLPNKIKVIGLFLLNIILHSDIDLAINLIVARSKQEANEIIKNIKKVQN